jgi:nucleoid DNA-binding protein
MHFDQQPEIVELIRLIAKKYGISYTRAEEAITSRFYILREQLKKTDITDDKIYNVRLYKFGLFYISNRARRKFKENMVKYWKRIKGEEEVVTNLNTNQDAESK